MSNETDPATSAVRNALIDSGYHERNDGRFRVEVGFALRPRDLAVTMPREGQTAQVISPAAGRTIGLCKRRAYVLTIVFVERQTGKIASRAGATVARCSNVSANLLPRLARAALDSTLRVNRS